MRLIWWPNWYVTRLHAVNPVGLEGQSWYEQPIAVCGASTINPERAESAEWQGRRMANGGPPQCKLCLKRIAAHALPHDSEHADSQPPRAHERSE